MGLLAALYGSAVLRTTRVSWPQGEALYDAVLLSRPVPASNAHHAEAYVRGQRVMLTLPTSVDSLQPGCCIRFTSHIYSTATSNTIGGFSYDSYLRHHDITGRVYVPTYTPSPLASQLSLPRFLALKVRLQTWSTDLSSHLSNASLSAPQQAVLKAMTLGIRDELDSTHTDLYRQSGSSHLLALSGLHLGILVALLSLFVTSRLRFSRFYFVAVVFILPSLWSYAFLTGLPSSLVRSVTMVSILFLSRLLKRTATLLRLLAISVFIILLVDPMGIYDVGFLLSCSAVAFVAIALSPMQQVVKLSSKTQTKLSFRLHKALRWVWGLFCVSLLAWLGTMPLAVCYFHSFQPWSPLASLILVPTTTVLMYLALLMALLATIGLASLASLIATLIGILFDFQWSIMHLLTDAPGVRTHDVFLSPLGVVLLYVALLALLLILHVHNTVQPHRFPSLTRSLLRPSVKHTMLCLPDFCFSLLPLSSNKHTHSYLPSIHRALCFHLLLAAFLLLIVLPFADRRLRNPVPQLIVYDTPRCPSAHFILSSSESYLLPARPDSVWVNMEFLHSTFWAYHHLHTPQRLDHLPAFCHDGLVRLSGATLLQLHDARWLSLASPTSPLPLDVLHVCHGYFASMHALKPYFSPRMVVLDRSLGWRRARLLKQQCDSLHWPHWDIRSQGPYRISLHPKARMM